MSDNRKLQGYDAFTHEVFCHLATQIRAHICAMLVYIHMYAAHDIRRLICNGEFSPNILNIL